MKGMEITGAAIAAVEAAHNISAECARLHILKIAECERKWPTGTR
ncbi:MAG: hypothetical protein V1816_00515 [Pseudomonadota bacterium]